MDSIIKQSIETILNNLKNEFDIDQKNILVTGGAGFLGSWICDILVEKRANVICLDNFTSGLKENISHLFDEDNFEFINHDITQPIHFDKKLDLILHLASRASPFEFEKFPIQILKANTLGTWIVLGIAKGNSCPLLFASTSEIYGNPPPEKVPTPEEYYGNVNPIGPRSCYDEAKRAGEAFVISYYLQHNLDVRIVRIFNTYGPRMRSGDVYGRVIPRFIEQALKNQPITVFGDGTQTRSFIFVSDEVEAIIRAALLPSARGKVMNIGSEMEFKIIDLAKIIKNLTKSSSEITFNPLPKDDPLRRSPDISKAKKILNWEPKISLVKGLELTIEWYRKKLEINK
ncbi:MAG: SDR family oxidoreductase [Candidatus Helarchaeota archaeon]|nr:SDR family oxidoreductase [Candidatus Helarchaeota archaeon]